VEPSNLGDDVRGPTRPSHLRLGEILIRRGHIGQDDLALALAQQDLDDHDAPLGRLLVEHGAITDEVLTSALAEQSGMVVVDVDVVDPDRALLDGIDRDDLLRLMALPLERGQGTTVVAVGEPPSRDFRRELVRRLHARLEFVLASPTALRRAIDRVYDERDEAPCWLTGDEPLDLVPATGVRYGRGERLALEVGARPAAAHTANATHASGTGAPDTTVAWLLALAEETGARALQLISEPGRIRLRARVDRDMRDVLEIPEPAASMVVRRVLHAFGRPADATRVDGASAAIGSPGFGPALTLTAAPTAHGATILLRPVTAREPAAESRVAGLDAARVELASLLAEPCRGLVLVACTDAVLRRTALLELAVDPMMHTRSVAAVGLGADASLPRVTMLDPSAAGGLVPALAVALELGNDVVMVDVDDARRGSLRAVVDAGLGEVVVIAGLAVADVATAIAQLGAAAGAPLVGSALALVVGVDDGRTSVMTVCDELREALFDGRCIDPLLDVAPRS